MANNPYVNKVIKGSTTIIDISGDTVAADKMLSGYTAHDASGAPIVGSIASGTAGTPTVSQSAMMNNRISVTPSVTNTAGYIAGGTITGTAVTVSASELVSGNLPITANGTGINVTNYETVSVAVPFSTITVSSSNPTGGSNGDIWLKTV